MKTKHHLIGTINFLINKSKAVITVLFLLVFVLNSQAQKSFSDLGSLKDRKWKKVTKSYANNSNFIPQLEGLIGIKVLDKNDVPNPKKIGLLSFQIWDESITKSRKSGNWRYYEKHWLTDSGSNIIADKLLDIMYPVLEKEFQNKGIKLQQPTKFLDSEEKKKIYSNDIPNIELSGITKFANNSIFRRLQGMRSGQGSTAATNYTFFPVGADVYSSDIKSPAQIGKIAEKLDLDAVLIIGIKVSIERGGKSLVFRGVDVVISGPINDDESIEYKGRIGAKMMNQYRDGLVFSSVLVQPEAFKIADMKRKTGEITKWYLDDLDLVTERISDDLLVGLKKFKNLDKSKKK
ncbi:hypothetical protein [Polaribacter sp.]|uniref:hypothetical protein n=1 Tax=Polaribacter sp. TaxID=1920175 RepID=UPI003F6C1569